MSAKARLYAQKRLGNTPSRRDPSGAWEQKRMDRFTVRGRQKVNIQWRLYCLVHNIGKIANCAEMYAKAS